MAHHRKSRASETDRAVGDRLRLARNLAGMTQSELGAVLGVSYQQVQKYERGIHCLSAGQLERAAKRLAHPIAWFFDAPNHAPPDDREALRLASMIAKLPEPQRQSAIRVLEIIVASQAASTLAIAGE